MIHVIAAVDERGALGKQGKLLCHVPLDLHYFKKMTQGQSILMGRKTFESIGKALPQRENFVLTRQSSARFLGCITVTSMEEALRQKHSDILWVIGGGEIYQQYLGYADKIFLTKIHHAFDSADTYFPPVDAHQWQKISEKFHQVGEKNAYPLSFQVYQNKKPSIIFEAS